MESNSLLPSRCAPGYETLNADGGGAVAHPQHLEEFLPAQGNANVSGARDESDALRAHVIATCSRRRRHLQAKLQAIDRDAVHFGVRMAACMTVSSLFILVQSPGDGAKWPSGMWVLITVLFVCWFPSTLDAASVVEKSIQRLIGTMIGATVGLSCGFLSLAVLGQDNNVGGQATFVGCCIAAVTFVICWSALQFKIRGTRIIARYNYACILCLLTFLICLLPFYSEDEKKWVKAMYRIVNVIVGCIIGAGLSIFVLPRSTVSILKKKIETQITLAGEASQAVLHAAADCFSESTYVPLALAEEMLESPTQLKLRRRLTVSRRPWRNGTDAVDLGGDVVLEKYESAIKEWRATKSQLSMLKYDPFNIGAPDELLAAFRMETANTVTRALRIQTTVNLLDGIIRNDPKHDFSEDHLATFADIGTLIRQMLTVPLHLESTEPAAKKLNNRLCRVRRFIIELSSVVAHSSQEMPDSDVGTLRAGILSSRHDLPGMLGRDVNNVCDAQLCQEDDKGGRGAPKFVHGSHVCALLFLQLVEHLTLRSIRLYQSWKNCEDICQAAARRKKDTKGQC